MIRSGDLSRAMINASANRNGNGPVRPDGLPLLTEYRPFPVSALPPSVEQFVGSVAGATATDPAWAALATIVVMAGCVGNRAAVVLRNGWEEPSVLWGCLVGKSGTTKSAVLHLVSRPLVDELKKEREAFLGRQSEFRAAVEAYNVQLAKWKADLSAGHRKDPPIEPERPNERRTLVSDVTIERLKSMLATNPLGLLAVCDELSALLGSFDRYARGKGSDLLAWLSMNEAKMMLVDRKGDGASFVSRAAVSVIGTIQPYVLERAFGALERESGLLARFLLAYPPPRPPLWTENELSVDAARDWCQLLRGLLALEPSYDESDHVRPKLLHLDSDAKSHFVAWHDKHVHAVDEMPDDHLRAHWSKLRGACARMALVLACAEAAIGGNVTSVSLDSMERAICITEWLKHESARIYGGLGASKEERELVELVQWIMKRGETVSVREVTKGMRRYRNQPQEAYEALERLNQLGVGRWLPSISTPTGGRPSDRFELTSQLDVTVTKTPRGDTGNRGFGDGDGSSASDRA